MLHLIHCTLSQFLQQEIQGSPRGNRHFPHSLDTYPWPMYQSSSEPYASLPSAVCFPSAPSFILDLCMQNETSRNCSLTEVISQGEQDTDPATSSALHPAFQSDYKALPVLKCLEHLHSNKAVISFLQTATLF